MEKPLIRNASRGMSPWMFLVLVFALSLPFWLAGALTTFQLLPVLPISALMAVCPVTAAAICAYRAQGFGGVKHLLGRVGDFQRITRRRWYAPIMLLMPAIMALSYGVMRLMGVPVPVPSFSLETTLALFVIFFLGALGEELGWSGYAIDPLQERFGALWGALVLGMVWAIWHVIPLLEVPRSLDFIIWWSLGTVAARILIVWLYNNTGRSVFAAALFHTMVNLTWQLFPINGSYYDPRITGVITAIVAVVIVWRSRLWARSSQRSTLTEDKR